MHKKNFSIEWRWCSLVSAVAVALFTGCQTSSHTETSTQTQSSAATTTAAAPAAPAAATASAQTPAAPAAPAAVAPAEAPASGGSEISVTPPVRIKAGGSGFTDADGNTWVADEGFDGGDTVERPDTEIANTKSPAIYRAERYSMNSFSCKLPNGKYTVKLHFAETYEGIDGAGQRVFSINVQGHEFKDFDVWAKAGGARKAYVETVPVEVTNGQLKITFTPNVENPEINGIEILPAS